MGKEPNEIRQEIEETRERMGETVGAIGYKADVPARARESVANKKDNIVGSVRGAKDRVVESIVGTKESMGESMSNATESISGSMSSAGESISSSAGRVGEALPSAQDVRQGARRTKGLAQENPIGLAVGAVAVGFIAGMMVPATRLERRTIGPVADDVVDKARETGQEALERGKYVAQQAADTARQVATEAASTAQESAQRGVDDLRDTAQEQGQGLASSAQDKVADVAGSSGDSDEQLGSESQAPLPPGVAPDSSQRVGY